MSAEKNREDLLVVRTLKGAFFLGLGYMLSPLSWWNDLFFNLPIAYAFGYFVSLFVPQWFFPATVIGYWLSNILGFVLMQFGIRDIAFTSVSPNLKKDLVISLSTSTLYTVVVVVLFQLNILDTPDFVTTQLSQP